VDETTGDLVLVGLTGELPLGLVVGRSKRCETGAADPGGRGRGTRGGNGCIGALEGDETPGDAPTTGLCAVGATRLCPIGAVELLVILTNGLVAVELLAVPSGLALGDDVFSGDDVGGAIGVRSVLRASVDKAELDAGAMGAAGATIGLALGAVVGIRFAPVRDGVMGFNEGEAVGWNNVSK
jgi:hypothetical protein